MDAIQDYKRRRILPVKSVNQLVHSYLVAETIVEIRREVEDSQEEFGKERIPKLHDSASPFVKKLYEDSAVLLKFNPLYVWIMNIAINDMINYEFSKDPSVVQTANQDVSHLNKIFSDNFKKLANINLMEHTINVFNEAFLTLSKKGRTHGVHLSLLGALLHDFGKSTKLRSELLGEAGQRGYRAHSDVSGIYVQEIIAPKLYEIMGEIPVEIIENLSRIVRNHHSPGKKLEFSVQFIQEVDTKARKNEYKKILEKDAKEGY